MKRWESCATVGRETEERPVCQSRNDMPLTSRREDESLRRSSALWALSSFPASWAPNRS